MRDRGLFWRGLSLLGLVLLWAGVTRFHLVDPIFVPSPWSVLESSRDLAAGGELQTHVLASLRRVVIGFAAGSAAAIVLGVLIGASSRLLALFAPLVELARPLPALALIPLILVWFGIGETGKVMLIVYAVFIPVATNAMHGVARVPIQIRQAAANLGARRHRLIVKVLLPAAMPDIASGLIVAMSQAFSVLVAAELIAASVGLGYMIQEGRRFFRTDMVILGMAVIGTLGWLLIASLRMVSRILLPWHEDVGRERPA